MSVNDVPRTIEQEAVDPVQPPKVDKVNRASGGSNCQRAIFFFFTFLVGFYLVILVAGLGEAIFLRDPDVYWHVAVGQDIWLTKSLPHFDELSHTFLGKPWIAKEWLGQLLLSGAYALEGWRGVVLLAAGAVAMAYALLFLALARTMRVTVAVGVATLSFLFSVGDFSARPVVFSDPLIVIWVASLVKSVETRAAPNPLLLLVMALWANLHGSFTFGLAIGGALAAEAVFDGPADQLLQRGLRWGAFLVAALVAACVTPYGFRPILTTFQVFIGNDALNYVQEWRPATLESIGVNELSIFGLLILTLHFGVKLPFWRLISTIALVYLMFAHIRFAALFAIVTPLLLATPVARQFPFLRLTTQLATQPQFFDAMARASRRLFYPLCCLIAGGIAAFAAYGPMAAPKSEITPSAAINYIYKEDLVGNVYNSYNFGGYLIFRGIKTFIDGRSDQLFGNGFLTRLVRITTKTPKEFIQYLDEYKVSIALVAPGGLDAQELESSSRWEMVYSDAVSVLFRKR